MSKILVTGGTGFVGHHIINELEKTAGVDVLYTYRSNPLSSSAANGLQLDLTDLLAYPPYQATLAQVECLVHAAATVEPTVGNIIEDIDRHLIANLANLRNLIANLPRLNKIIFISSCSAEIAPTDPTLYGMGKLLTEELVARIAKSKKIQHTILRFPQIYGSDEPHGTFITNFLAALNTGKTITLVNDGSVIRDVVSIGDVTGSVIYALLHDISGVFTITDPATHTVKEVLDELVAATGKEPHMIHRTIEPSEVAQKSFHFQSTAADLGYTMLYSLKTGIEALVREERLCIKTIR